MDTEIVTKYYSSIFNRAFSILKCHHTAEDVAQQVITKLNKQLTNKPDMADHFIGAWLIVVTKNQCFKVLQKNKRMVLREPSEFNELEDTSSIHSEIYEKEEMKNIYLEKIKKIIKKLPPRKQQVIELRYIKELSYKEIADQLGLSVGNVGFLLNKTIHTIRRKML